MTTDILSNDESQMLNELGLLESNTFPKDDRINHYHLDEICNKFNLERKQAKQVIRKMDNLGWVEIDDPEVRTFHLSPKSLTLLEKNLKLLEKTC